MLSKRYKYTEVDRRTWLHVPSGTPWSTSSDTHQVVEILIETSTKKYTPLKEMCVAYFTRLAESYRRFWNKNSQKISTKLAMHHLQRFPATDAAASTHINFCTF